MIEPDGRSYKFPSWSEKHFRMLTKNRFQREFERVSDLGKDEKRLAKKELLEQVLSYIGSNRAEGRDEFANSAAEVISFLQELELALSNLWLHRVLKALPFHPLSGE